MWLVTKRSADSETAIRSAAEKRSRFSVGLHDLDVGSRMWLGRYFTSIFIADSVFAFLLSETVYICEIEASSKSC